MHVEQSRQDVVQRVPGDSTVNIPIHLHMHCLGYCLVMVVLIIDVTQLLSVHYSSVEQDGNDRAAII